MSWQPCDGAALLLARCFTSQMPSRQLTRLASALQQSDSAQHRRSPAVHHGKGRGLARAHQRRRLGHGGRARAHPLRQHGRSLLAQLQEHKLCKQCGGQTALRISGASAPFVDGQQDKQRQTLQSSTRSPHSMPCRCPAACPSSHNLTWGRTACTRRATSLPEPSPMCAVPRM